MESSVAYNVTDANPAWLNKADNAWQLTSSALVMAQSVPGLIILYGSMVKKKWAVNSAFMALYAFAAVLLFWVLLAHRMSFPASNLSSSIVGFPNVTLSEGFLLGQNPYGSADVPVASYVFFQFAFAAITVILLAGSVLCRMNFYAWMMFVPLWLVLSYSVGACTIWSPGGFLEGLGLVDFSGGYVIHLSSGVAGFTAAYWVGPRISMDRKTNPPNNIILMLGGAGMLWLGWTGFNGGAPNASNLVASMAVLNTHICTATSLIVWLCLDMVFYKKSSVIGAVQGMMTGLVCITPGAGVVESWAAMVMGVFSGSVPWYTMMILHKRSPFLQKVDDTLGVFHTHAVAGLLGGILSGMFAQPDLVRLFYPTGKQGGGLVYRFSQEGLRQVGVQIMGACFVFVWNVVVTSLICIAIGRVVPLRMKEEDLHVGDDAAHGEEAYALWGDGEKSMTYIRRNMTPRLPVICGR
ncbi:Ammonium transporter 2 member 1 [Acorus gramineus]|uniref:Ammonium transporter n=1 Tax=Acorus gramineus TaxID=55184 RepID=A0AAV9BAQ5_ACOGR|nr:Ammonium transporter 2 member 1 [Acorus gramineus]